MKAGVLIALIPLLAFSQQAANLTIQGTVFVNDTNQPLAGAQVSLTKTAAPGSFPPAIAPILTDSRGMFLFRNLEAGSYRLTVIKGGGYVQQDSSLTLSEREPANNLTIRMPQTVIVSGRIRDESGRPVVDAPVELLRRAYNQNGLNLQSAFSTQTNDLGEYRLYGITPGRYYLAAGTTDNRSYSRKFEASIFDEQVRKRENSVYIDYGRAYHPGVADLSKATILDLQAGSNRSNVDFTVSRQVLFDVRGRVTMSTTGLPPKQLNWSGASGEKRYDPKTGQFELRGLLPNSYAFSLDWDSLRAFVTVNVSVADIDGLLVSLEPSTVVTGRIEVEGTLPENSRLDRMYVFLRRREMSNYEVSGNNVREDGTVELEDVPARDDYRVAVSGLPSGFYLKSARIGGADALNSFVPVARSARLDITISSRTAQIRVVVTNDRLQPVGAAQVVLIPEFRERTELFKPGLTNKDGQFTFGGVPPGNYKLFAWQDLERFAFYDPEILAQFEERGRPIRVEESSELSFDLKAIP